MENVLENLYYEDTETIYVINECKLRARFIGMIKFDGHLSDELLLLTNIMKKIMAKPLENTLDKIMKRKIHLADTPTAHTLWYEYLSIVGEDIIYQLKVPSRFQLVR